MDPLEEQRRRLRELRNKHVVDVLPETVNELPMPATDRDAIEREIRQQLQTEYELKLQQAIAELKSDETVLEEYPVISVSLPTSEITKVKVIDNSILTLHKDNVCVWNDQSILVHKLQSYSIINDAISESKIDSVSKSVVETIITATESGRISIHTLNNKSIHDTELYSFKTYTPIISIHKTKNTIIAVCKNGTFFALALNLVDELIKPTQLVQDTEIMVVEFINDSVFAFSTLHGQTYIYNISEMHLEMIHESKLPVLSLSYCSAYLFILSLDKSVTKVSLSALHKSVIDLHVLSFNISVQTPSAFVVSTLEGVDLYENDQLTKSIKLSNITDMGVITNTAFCAVGNKIVNLEL